MRRSARGEQSAFSLFPFLAVLLCTMGSLVVLLVAMAQISREKAQLEAEAARLTVEAAQHAADSPQRRELEQQLAQADAALSRLRLVKAEGTAHLTQEQKRLSDIEDHLHRLRDESEALVAETKELIAVEDQHYDDAKIAQHELERLNRLIGEIQEEIELLKHAATGRERKFAVVPLRDGRTGTLRPPVYYECTESGVVLQPEGIRLTWQDLVAGDFSSPVNAASRAVSRYFEEHPEARAANESGRPYPLLIVRPDGVYSYYQARAALEEAGVDYGYQPVAADWPLEYGETNPVLAAQVEDAVRTARAEREGLAKMIPKLGAAMAAAENDARMAIALSNRPPSSGAYSASGGSLDGAGAVTAVGGIRVRPANPDSNNPFDGLRIEGSLPDEVGAFGSGTFGSGTFGSGAFGSGNPSLSEEGEAASLLASATAPATQPMALPTRPLSVTEAGGSATTGPEGVAATAPDEQPATAAKTGEASLGQRYGVAAASADPSAKPSSPADPQNPLATTGNEAEQAAAQTSGQASIAVDVGSKATKNPATNAAPAKSSSARGGVPMVRPIRLYVSHERAVVLSDSVRTSGEMAKASSTAEGVTFDGTTTARINDLIGLLKKHADSWGIAGDGMYWDPRLVLNVAADGVQRADDVRRLLEAAGVQVQAYPVTTAANPDGGPDASRR